MALLHLLAEVARLLLQAEVLQPLVEVHQLVEVAQVAAPEAVVVAEAVVHHQVHSLQNQS
jgi:hypothetical protein